MRMLRAIQEPWPSQLLHWRWIRDSVRRRSLCSWPFCLLSAIDRIFAAIRRNHLGSSVVPGALILASMICAESRSLSAVNFPISQLRCGVAMTPTVSLSRWGVAAVVRVSKEEFAYGGVERDFSRGWEYRPLKTKSATESRRFVRACGRADTMRQRPQMGDGGLRD